MTIAAIEYTDARQMLADYAARRARMYAPPPPAVAELEPEPEPKVDLEPKHEWRPVGPRSGLAWRSEEIATLHEMAAEFQTARAIAKCLHRSLGSVQAQARKMGVIISLKPRKIEIEEADLVCLPGGPLRSIIINTAASYGFTDQDILSDCRNLGIIEARHHAMWLCVRDTKLSYPIIGKAFGRDHTTVLHAVRRVNAIMGANIRNAGLPR